MAQQGEAAQYFQGGGGDGRGYQMNPPPNGGQWQQQPPQQGYGYGAPNQQGYQQQQYNGDGGSMPPPPNYGQQYGGGDQKPMFDQAFKIEKPKWNDLWAGILFLAVCAGFVAVSGISIQGYAATKGFNGGGIYDSSNEFGLSTNTLVLFAFCLAVAPLAGFLGLKYQAPKTPEMVVWMAFLSHSDIQ